MQRIVLGAVAVAAAGAVGFGVGRSTVQDGLLQTQGEHEPVVARYEGVAVGAPEVVPVLSQFGSSASASVRMEALEQFVRVRLLALAAEREGLHRSPDFLRRYQEELAQAYVEKRFEAPFKTQLPQEGELKQFFDEYQAQLGRPERIRLAHVALLAPVGDDRARSVKRSVAQAVLKDAQAHAEDEYAFGTLASARSEDARSRPSAGELPFLTREELAARLGPEVAEAAFSMKPGQVAPRVVETEQGFQVLKVLAREEGHAADYARVRDAIRVRLSAERRDKAFKAFLQRHWNPAHLEVDEAALAAAAVAPTAAR